MPGFAAPALDALFDFRAAGCAAVGARRDALLDRDRGRDVVEAGIVGHEGVAGLPLFLGVAMTHTGAVCQVAGGAERVRGGLAPRR